MENVAYDKENYVNNNPAFFLLTNVVQKSKKDGNPYYSCSVRDSKTVLSANIWEWEEGQEPISGVVALATYSYKRKYGLSLKIRKLYTLEELNNHIDDAFSIFLPRVENIENLKDELSDLIQGIENAFLKELLEKTISPGDGEIKGFFLAPAATKNHHVKIGGLLEHSVNVAKLCKIVARTFGDDIDMDLLIAGALLHDIGKVQTYDYKSYSFEFTDEGLLEDHIVLGIKKLAVVIGKIDGFPKEIEQNLFHIVASHHGLKEWGSPVVPRTLEAIIIHNCDRLEAQMEAFRELARSVPKGGSWSDYSGILGTKVFVYGKYGEDT
ncbi:MULTISPECIES: 3'-5' exoribonuclease YhaM family protein [Kosmotoga]|uniref:Metal dependent phosphohydrolase n=1 Tax=Kosmotoga olearia (strain ATCC BAA-1733 / DSM 21960 / TBF 19.5.1) TaxID=521045 RepID=C5CIY9_KOSOT|nr:MULTISPECIES: HD domain-containing protein [Kosmotoga]ACR79905.1 metal dependent phosphohydrolase [Kosmotoga olearia TBF 19.5.1]MDK2953724.1 3-5 exoribonuclease [Kosmotoga sp.]